MYFIETRLRDKWQRVHLETHPTLTEAVRALERMLDTLFFEHNVTIEPNNFRIVKVK
jgi:hypothetical protein